MIVVDLPEGVATSVETMAARVGMTASAWLSDQIIHAYGTGRVIAQDQPRKPSRSTRRRIAAAKRAERAAARASQTSEPAIDPIL